MPILKTSELAGYIGSLLAKQLTRDVDSFEKAEASASATVHTVTGLVIPSDPDNAPDWAKEVVAFIVQFKRMNVLANLSPATAAVMQAQYREALQVLERNKIAVPTGRPGSETGTIDGMITW